MFFLSRRYFRYFDWISFFLIVILCLVGLAFVFSSTYQQDKLFSVFFKKQLFGIASGLIIYLICSMTNFYAFCRIGYNLNFLVIALLIFTKLKGSIGMGAQRWINLVIFKFQPSELAKLFFPPFITHYLHVHKDILIPKFRDFLYPILVMLTTTILILRQPDLGTALLFFFSGLLVLWFAGMKPKFFIWFFLISAICAPILWRSLKPYQKQRISVFLGYGDTKKEGYQIEQAKIAVGSGGITGKGFLKGTQNKFSFLPEGRTDFIFAVLCEEWGFLGALLIIFIYSFLFMRLLLKIKAITNFSAQLLAIALLLYTMLAVTINTGMVVGLLPIVGIPLPFMSYGISHLWITLANFGIIQSIIIRQSYTENK